MAEFFKSVHGKTVEVYVQDPGLQEADEEALMELSCKIMNGRYGHQQGFTKIDDTALVYDAIIYRDIFQIYMEYSRPAAVTTSLLDGIETRDLHGDGKYIIIEDERIEQGTQIAWLGPPSPSEPTRATFNILRDEYREVSLIDEERLRPEARQACTTLAAAYRELHGQTETEKQFYENEKKTDSPHPPGMHDHNFSAQGQLALYVRK